MQDSISPTEQKKLSRDIKLVSRPSDKEILTEYFRIQLEGDEEPNDGQECHFILEWVIRDSNYSKWFDLLGKDLKTGKKRVLPIRNDIVNNFVEEHWEEWYSQGRIDHWDLYRELSALEIPMIWKENKSKYLIPYKCLSEEKWELLNKAMEDLAERGDKRILTHEERMKRFIMVYK